MKALQWILEATQKEWIIIRIVQTHIKFYVNNIVVEVIVNEEEQ